MLMLCCYVLKRNIALSLPIFIYFFSLDGENLDYPDVDSEEEDITAKNVPESTLEQEDVSHKSSINLSFEKSVDDTVLLMEQGSSMEGSDKAFAVFGASEEKSPKKNDNVSLEASSILIGGAVVSVVTTKSVVNGTISVPTTTSPTTTEQVAPPISSSSSAESMEQHLEITTEDSSRILASVQTSRSISGARFLQFPVIDRVEQVEAHGGGSLESKKTSQPPFESTESIIDKLDWAQSKLSSDLLPAAILGTGSFRNAGNALQLDMLAEKDSTTTRRSLTTTIKTPIISKFVPRRYNDRRLDHGSTTSTMKPRLETTVNNLEGLLPRNYVLRGTTPSTGNSKINFKLDILYIFLLNIK